MGWVIKFAGGAISWLLRRQDVVTQSTIEAEYIALSDIAKQMMWLRNLLIELKFIPEALPICIDNHGAAYNALR